jgi:hypothetical protein
MATGRDLAEQLLLGRAADDDAAACDVGKKCYGSASTWSLDIHDGHSPRGVG